MAFDTGLLASLVLLTFSNANNVLAAVAVNTSVAPVPAVVLPSKEAVAILACLASVTAPYAIFSVVTASVASFPAVTFASAIFAVVTALAAIAGKAAVPARSPANWILPLTKSVASGVAAVDIAAVTKAVVAI